MIKFWLAKELAEMLVGLIIVVVFIVIYFLCCGRGEWNENID